MYILRLHDGVNSFGAQQGVHGSRLYICLHRLSPVLRIVTEHLIFSERRTTFRYLLHACYVLDLLFSSHRTSTTYRYATYGANGL